MNFIAGMFYLIYKDEAITFSMITEMISKFKLEALYKHDVPLLKIFIYQMNRLMAIFLPRLHYHIYNQGINSGYLCTSWFITMFTYILHDKKDLPILFETIFDKFLAVILKII